MCWMGCRRQTAEFKAQLQVPRSVGNSRPQSGRPAGHRHTTGSPASVVGGQRHSTTWRRRSSSTELLSASRHVRLLSQTVQVTASPPPAQLHVSWHSIYPRSVIDPAQYCNTEADSVKRFVTDIDIDNDGEFYSNTRGKLNCALEIDATKQREYRSYRRK